MSVWRITDFVMALQSVRIPVTKHSGVSYNVTKHSVVSHIVTYNSMSIIQTEQGYRHTVDLYCELAVYISSVTLHTIFHIHRMSTKHITTFIPV